MNHQNKIINGKYHAEVMLGKLAEELATFRSVYQIIPSLTVVLVGENPSSLVYVKNKVLNARAIGIHSNLMHLPPSISQDGLLGILDDLNNDPNVHGIIVQMPLPEHIDPLSIISSIDPEKDVDGFHPINVGKLHIGDTSGYAPCTPLGCLHLLKEYNVELEGKRAVVIGRSQIVGKPVASLLLRENCTVTTCHSYTQDLADITRQADIVVSAIGMPHSLDSSYFKAGATVLDVGITRVENEGKARLFGDVDFDDVIGKVGLITPVPGGVGPMTVAYLLKNTFKAAMNQLC